ncbi:BRCT domain-containing DNA repair protein [Striga asiatica]|uniref:BRCT domain-containing DNA repair protein n=1 Tax=Striga asiatica TaxID=4170 RepID=A0A5A7PB97_STRAF|nr:BRCT domain-containing DNA repair protein [Striga asiatica]
MSPSPFHFSHHYTRRIPSSTAPRQKHASSWASEAETAKLEMLALSKHSAVLTLHATLPSLGTEHSVAAMLCVGGSSKLSLLIYQHVLKIGASNISLDCLRIVKGRSSLLLPIFPPQLFPLQAIANSKNSLILSPSQTLEDLEKISLKNISWSLVSSRAHDQSSVMPQHAHEKALAYRITDRLPS